MPGPYAIVDLGTNTFHLLIGDQEAGGMTILHREQVPVKLMAEGYEEGSISAEAYHRGLSAIAKFEALLNHYQAVLVGILGTSALRNAGNAPDFLTAVEAQFQCPVQLINGAQEATLIYEGVREAVQLPASPALILDIGGGSVELIAGTNEQCLWKQSLEIGAARLIQLFPHHFPVQEAEQQAIRSYLGEALAPVLPTLQSYQPTLLVGASGFFETFVKLDRHQQANKPETPMPRSYTLSLARFADLKKQVLTRTTEQLHAMPGMEAFRVPMMGVSTLLADYLLQHLPLQSIAYANYAMKEGALATFLKGHNLENLPA